MARVRERPASRAGDEDGHARDRLRGGRVGDGATNGARALGHCSAGRANERRDGEQEPTRESGSATSHVQSSTNGERGGERQASLRRPVSGACRDCSGTKMGRLDEARR